MSFALGGPMKKMKKKPMKKSDCVDQLKKDSKEMLKPVKRSYGPDWVQPDIENQRIHNLSSHRKGPGRPRNLNPTPTVYVGVRIPLARKVQLESICFHRGQTISALLTEAL